ncbi:hypothetical protein AMJ47_01565 [Parcubacteria bacterium DG_72]|nr:MAG: hypothetical protein AMJ47_01565 [Parcubacteria bacterium DG_72]
MEKYFQRFTGRDGNILYQYKPYRKHLFLYLAFLTIFFILPGQISADTASASVSVKSLSAPSNLTATSVSTSRIDLTWSSVSDAVSYKVYRAGSLIASPTTTSYSDTGLSPGTSYSYTVSSVNTFGGESEQSSSVSATAWIIRVGGGGRRSIDIPSVSPPSPLSPEAQKVDTNKDSKIDLLDFNILIENWRSTIKGNVADVNNDDRVDIFDFNLLMIYWTK